MAMEPAPAPTSQSSSPGRGARADSVSARMSCFVSWPSCSKALSGKLPRQGTTRAVGPAQTSMATRLRLRTSSRARAEAAAERTRSSRAPRHSSTCSVESPKPRSVSSCARRPGVSRSQDRASTRRPGRRYAGLRPARGRAATPRPCPAGASPGATQPGTWTRAPGGTPARQARAPSRRSRRCRRKTGRRWPARRCRGHAGPEPLLCLRRAARAIPGIPHARANPRATAGAHCRRPARRPRWPAGPAATGPRRRRPPRPRA